MVKLSAVVLTYNESRNIARCLKSLQPVADEILVVDSFSEDDTVAIAESHGARVVQHHFEGYIEQKNYATRLATYDFVLSLDADEALSEELVGSILRVKQNFSADAYKINRLSNYCGHWVRHCGWYPDWKIRLFRKGVGHWAGMNPHDRFELAKNTRVEKLNGNLYHYTYYSQEEHRQQILKFADIAAKTRYEQGVRTNALMVVAKPVAKFIKGYIIKLGFLDGYYGWVICTRSAWATYLRYKTLYNLQNNG
ncbi:MAG: glycosyltransferase family 2 protein [Salibacteraceae bacterium]